LIFDFIINSLSFESHRLFYRLSEIIISRMEFWVGIHRWTKIIRKWILDRFWCKVVFIWDIFLKFWSSQANYTFNINTLYRSDFSQQMVFLQSAPTFLIKRFPRWYRKKVLHIEYVEDLSEHLSPTMGAITMANYSGGPAPRK